VVDESDAVEVTVDDEIKVESVVRDVVDWISVCELVEVVPLAVES
jgi:hypothetical protein